MPAAVPPFWAWLAETFDVHADGVPRLAAADRRQATRSPDR